jgi:DNA-binding response OmpR family regulator
MSKNKTILIVDDDEDIIKTIQERLDFEGYKTITAPDGTDAINLIEKGARPDLILLDLMMPQGNGVITLNIIRAKPETKKTPVIVISAMEASSIETDIRGLGITDFIQKPCEMNTLVKKINAALV